MEKVAAAVFNNIRWCEIVCETHGIVGRSTGSAWRTTSKAPAYYPDIITSSNNATVEEIAEMLSNKETASVKDSFANLDLSSLGLGILFEAEWIYHAPLADLKSIPPGWSQVRTDGDLSDWTLAHGSGNVIKSSLLEHRDVNIYICEKKGVVGGFIAALGAGVVGISNVFSNGDLVGLWSDIPQVVSQEFPGIPVVGYEQGTDLRAAIQSGWASLGPLRIWVNQ
ncbi:hypothetical protein [Cohnella sp. AR92]|uniref:hypothetical protein n=1 Tax=Cohnella sp. AR92 TaxID=648716 RepID=UPI000F8CED00|nr:hypothetical protein [Cohnella sp. AR92]RUS47431.1 hypothetical protein ELR57_09945 [Cohnella sp. AR92]